MAESMDNQITQLADLLRQSDRAVVFSGMGISTDSGPPKFRKPYKIIQFGDFIGSEDIRLDVNSGELSSRAAVWIGLIWSPTRGIWQWRNWWNLVKSVALLTNRDRK